MIDNTEGKKTLRCAIYTRKSHEEGLEQEFNSLDAQRESAESYIESQRMQGWEVIPEHYNDGGFSGGNMERPALVRLLADIDAGKIDIIVVYKIDRLSRSLLDFMKMIEIFNQKGVSFVSVTQHFSTTDPTGRMFLGILITFAQYERETIAERIRDKVAMAKKRGKYCGGTPILGYDVDRKDKKLLVNDEEAKTVQYIFARFAQNGTVIELTKELNEQGYKTKAWTTKKGKIREGTEWNTAQVYRLLNNRTYIGEITHKEKSYPGEQEAIIDKKTWNKAQAILADNKPVKVADAQTKAVTPLKGVIRCGHCNCSMGPTYTMKKDRRYAYYICEKDQKRAVSNCPIKRVPAGDIEKAVLEQLNAVFRTPTLVAKTYFAAKDIEKEEHERLVSQKGTLEKEMVEVRKKAGMLASLENMSADQEKRLIELNDVAVALTQQIGEVSARCLAFEETDITESDISTAFQRVETLWDDLFPVEQNRLVRLLVEKVDIRETGIDMEIKTNGLAALISDLAGLSGEVAGRAGQ